MLCRRSKVFGGRMMLMGLITQIRMTFNWISVIRLSGFYYEEGF